MLLKEYFMKLRMDREPQCMFCGKEMIYDGRSRSNVLYRCENNKCHRQCAFYSSYFLDFLFNGDHVWIKVLNYFHHGKLDVITKEIIPNIEVSELVEKMEKWEKLRAFE